MPRPAGDRENRPARTKPGKKAGKKAGEKPHKKSGERPVVPSALNTKSMPRGGTVSDRGTAQRARRVILYRAWLALGHTRLPWPRRRPLPGDYAPLAAPPGVPEPTREEVAAEVEASARPGSRQLADAVRRGLVDYMRDAD